VNKAKRITAAGLTVALLAGTSVAFSLERSGNSTLIERNAKLRKQLKKERKEHKYLERIAAPILRPTPAGNRQLARVYFGAEFPCASEIITGETAGTWDHRIWNYEGSGAYGLGQAMPRSKMLPYAYAGLSPYDNPMPQLVWFKAYSKARYGSVCGASAHWTPNRSW
jgi:hypothetical protein